MASGLKLGLDNVFAGTRIEGGRDGSRRPFDVDFIRNVIVADGALARMNDEARDVIYILLKTGARPSEICNLSRRRIMLDADIPFIRVEAEDRLLKTEHSERDVPLVGRALEAMRRHPDGFPRYFDKADNFSATVAHHRQAEIPRRLWPEAQAEVSSGDRLDRQTSPPAPHSPTPELPVTDGRREPEPLGPRN
jgi:integrase